MKLKINFWAFIFSSVCIILFFIAASPNGISDFITNMLHINPLYIVLGLTIVTFFLGFIGFYEATNWELLVRSILTIVITFSLSVFILFILVANFLFT